MPRRRTRRRRRLLLGQVEHQTYWYFDWPGKHFLKHYNPSYYDEWLAPVDARWAMRADTDLLRAMGAAWILPLGWRIAHGGSFEFETVVDWRRRCGVPGEPEITKLDWSV